MKKLKYLVFIFILAVFIFVPNVKGTIKPYFSGEAASFQGDLYFGTVNNGSLELFKLEDSRIKRFKILSSDDQQYSRFFDLLLNVEGSRLYAYLVNGRYLYKYDISEQSNIHLIKKVKDNSGDYFHGLDRSSNRLLSIGTKGIKLWNYELQNITSYNVHSTFSENITISGNENYVLKVLKSQFRIIDTQYRSLAREIGLSTNEDHARHIYFDESSGASFVVDDQSLKKIYLDGRVTQFKHISKLGYDADALAGSPYVYFSDGVGIVKMDKNTLKPLAWRYTTNDGPANGWAMGLRVSADRTGEKIVLFNGSSIAVYGPDMQLIDYFEAAEGALPGYQPPEIRLDRYNGFSNGLLYVIGENFGPNERIKIEFMSEIWETQTNADGVFSARIRIPQTPYPNRRYDVKASGTESGSTYSVSFEVIE